MINYQNNLYSALKSAIDEEFGAGAVYTTAEYLKTPESFPAVLIIEDSQGTAFGTRDTGQDQFADLTYVIEVYSNRKASSSGTKQREARAIATIIDSIMKSCNFSGSFQVIPNFEDATIFRMVGRFSGRVDSAGTYYRRM
ncbi:MAG: hypothetical protein LBT32_01395 [Peptococcaceae bacterium]|nr:hypothetical protein [Peptococcaceae bacterium]